MHERIKFAGASVAGLNFIHDDQNVLLFAELHNFCNIICRKLIHAALALNRFDHDGGAGIFVSQAMQLRNVSGRCVDKSFRERSEFRVEAVLAGCRQCGDGAAVEAVLQRDDGMAAFAVLQEGIAAGRLDGTFVGLGSGV